WREDDSIGPGIARGRTVHARVGVGRLNRVPQCHPDRARVLEKVGDGNRRRHGPVFQDFDLQARPALPAGGGGPAAVAKPLHAWTRQGHGSLLRGGELMRGPPSFWWACQPPAVIAGIEKSSDSLVSLGPVTAPQQVPEDKWRREEDSF